MREPETGGNSSELDSSEDKKVPVRGRNGARRNGFTETSACVVIPYLMQENDVRINRPENVCRCSDPLRLYFRGRIMSRTVWKPFQIPSCDANLRFTATISWPDESAVRFSHTLRESASIRPSGNRLRLTDV